MLIFILSILIITKSVNVTQIHSDTCGCQIPQSSCTYRFLRHSSPPTIKPYGVDLPNGVLPQDNTIHITFNYTADSCRSNYTSMYIFPVQCNISDNGTVFFELNLVSPSPGLWYLVALAFAELSPRRIYGSFEASVEYQVLRPKYHGTRQLFEVSSNQELDSCHVTTFDPVISLCNRILLESSHYKLLSLRPSENSHSVDLHLRSITNVPPRLLMIELSINSHPLSWTNQTLSLHRRNQSNPLETVKPSDSVVTWWSNETLHLRWYGVNPNRHDNFLCLGTTVNNTDPVIVELEVSFRDECQTTKIRQMNSSFVVVQSVGSTTSGTDPDRQQFRWSLSLLPYLINSTRSSDVLPSSLQASPFVVIASNVRLSTPLHSEASQLNSLASCTLWPALSRVTLARPFDFHFTYQPRTGKYATAIRLPFWTTTNLPLHLEDKLDVGGTLEVALQLNPFHVGRVDGENRVQPVPRQLILHACLSTYPITNPVLLTSTQACPNWLRLATNKGLAVSLRHAASLVSNSSSAHDNTNTAFTPMLDRSFFFMPYPTPGSWFLTLYAECHSTNSSYCTASSSTPSTSPSASELDIALVIRSTSCLDFGCKSSGEGASIPPSGVLYRDSETRNLSMLGQSRWRPPWWQIDGTPSKSSLYVSPLLRPSSQSSNDADQHHIPSLCSIQAFQTGLQSICYCAPGRIGLGCMPMRDPFHRSLATSLFIEKAPLQPLSGDALVLVLSNLAFLPSIWIAAWRGLWTPALTYATCAIFSSIYHVCDTHFPSSYRRLFVALLTQSSRGQHSDDVPSEVPGSQACLLPIDVLSFCDFFLALLSFWVTLMSLAALPYSLGSALTVGFVVYTVVQVQAARYSVGLACVPFIVGFLLFVASWIYRSRQSRHLFPPLQWLLLGFLPGIMLALSGLGIYLYLSRQPDNYTLLHSIWHILMGLAPSFLLPWPSSWRRAMPASSSTSNYCCSPFRQSLTSDSFYPLADCFNRFRPNQQQSSSCFDCHWLLDFLVKGRPKFAWLLPYGIDKVVHGNWTVVLVCLKIAVAKMYWPSVPIQF